ncbi:hypothetical protein Tco_0531185 [Tanacetum coccineum]
MIGHVVLSSLLVVSITFKVDSLKEENPPEQSRLGVFLIKEVFKGGMIRIHYAFIHDEFDFASVIVLLAMYRPKVVSANSVAPRTHLYIVAYTHYNSKAGSQSGQSELELP